jgi:tetratricopeptide (TPR) repeat protein
VFGWLRRRRADAALRDADAATRAALLAVLDRDHDRAEALLVASAELDSRSVEPYLALARFYRTRGDIGRAIRLHQKPAPAPRSRPRAETICLADLAGDFRQGGFLQRAIASYEEVIERDPNHVGALRALVKLLGDAREHSRAIELQRRLARVENRDGAAELARALGRHGRGRARRGPHARRAPRGPSARCASTSTRGARVDPARHARGRARALEGRARGVVSRAADRAQERRARLSTDRVRLCRARPVARVRGISCAGCSRSAATTSTRGSRCRARSRRAARSRSRSPSCGACSSATPSTSARARVLGRLLLSEHRDPEATKEYAELLDVLDRRGLLRARERLG